MRNNNGLKTENELIESVIKRNYKIINEINRLEEIGNKEKAIKELEYLLEMNNHIIKRINNIFNDDIEEYKKFLERNLNNE